MQYPVYYTLDEARTILPKVQDKILQVIRMQKNLEVLNTISIDNEEGNPEMDLMITKLNMNYYKKLFLYHKYLGELLGLGIVIKDMQQGLIDFYSTFQGRDIHLCWRMGEKDISFWHEIDEGFAGRQSIEILERARS